MFFEVFLLVIIFLLLWIYFTNETELLAPGPPRWPIIGNLPTLFKKGTDVPTFVFLNELSKTYGKVMSLRVGMSKQIYIEDLELTKELFCHDLWCNRHLDNYRAERSFGKSLGLVFAEGEGWKEMRRFTLRTLREFGFGKQRTMEEMLKEELTDFIGRLNSQIDENNIVPTRNMFSVSVFNSLWSMMAGCRFSHDDDRIKQVIAMMDQEMNAIGTSIFMMFPFLWYITPANWSNRAKKRKALRESQFQFFKELLDERRAEGVYKDYQRDFIDVFLKEIDDAKNGVSKNPLSKCYTEEQFLVCCLDLFTAGLETTNNSLEFAFLGLILNPEVQKKVRAEVDEVVGRRRLPSAPIDKAKMPYTEATILETLRHANVLPLILRSPAEDTYVGKYLVTKDTVGLFNLWAIHMRDEFGDPEAFRPERFIDENGQLANTHKIIPFGLGKRACLGESLTRASLFNFLAGLVQNFTFELPEGEPRPNMLPKNGFTLSPHPYKALIKPRED